MKYLILLVFALSTCSSFAQDTGMIVGKLLDKSIDNQPLPFASITIKGTSTSSNSDATGLFLFENLKDGNYILVFNYPGYQSKELNVKVNALAPTEIKLSLEQKTMALSQVALLQSDNSNNTSTLKVKHTFQED